MYRSEKEVGLLVLRLYNMYIYFRADVSKDGEAVATFLAKILPLLNRLQSSRCRY